MPLPPRRSAKPPRQSGAPRSGQRRARPQTESTPAPAAGQRLQKVLAAAGVASRRECEERILQGRVEVDRQVVTELGLRVHPETQEIRVDGQILPQPKHVYFLVHKPMGVVSTNRDPARRTRVIDLVPEETRMFTVGRLDRSSEGLILVTNDGDLANQLTHPRYGIPKTYRAQVLGFPTPETLQKLRKGVHLAEGVARVAELKARGRHQRGAELEIVLTEGRNREIRRILARVGHKVLRLRRVALGPLKLGTLQAGESRRLMPAEVQALRHCVREQQQQAAKKPVAADTMRHELPGTESETLAKRPRSTGAAGPPAPRKFGKRTPTGEAGRGPKRPARSPHQGQERRGGPRRPKAGAVLDYDLPDDSAEAPRPPRPPRPPRTRSAQDARKKPARRKPEGKRRRP